MIDERINNFFEPITKAIESVVFVPFRLTKDKQISVSKNPVINGNTTLKEGDQVVYQYLDKQLLHLVKQGEDEDKKPIFDTVMLSSNRFITTAEGDRIDMKAPINALEVNSIILELKK